MKLICMVDDWVHSEEMHIKVELVYVVDLMPVRGRMIQVSEEQLLALRQGRMKHLLLPEG